MTKKRNILTIKVNGLLSDMKGTYVLIGINDILMSVQIDLLFK